MFMNKNNMSSLDHHVPPPTGVEPIYVPWEAMRMYWYPPSMINASRVISGKSAHRNYIPGPTSPDCVRFPPCTYKYIVLFIVAQVIVALGLSIG